MAVPRALYEVGLAVAAAGLLCAREAGPRGAKPCPYRDGR
jgi:hypothetical protein